MTEETTTEHTVETEKETVTETPKPEVTKVEVTTTDQEDDGA